MQNSKLMIFIILVSVASMAWAMAGNPPKKPQYKLEILKMEIIPSSTAEVKGVKNVK